tara:strand:+ start:24790 stop:25125 length:336 start_codon:yes stop_codon:yes gene_type:complete
MLFAGELEILLKLVEGYRGARFATGDLLIRVDAGSENFEVYTNSNTIIELLLNKSTCEQITEFKGEGCFRFSKEFFENRECGQNGGTAMGIRFQEAFKIQEDLGDRVSELK